MPRIIAEWFWNIDGIKNSDLSHAAEDTGKGELATLRHCKDEDIFSHEECIMWLPWYFMFYFDLNYDHNDP